MALILAKVNKEVNYTQKHFIIDQKDKHNLIKSTTMKKIEDIGKPSR